jgi:hypothetical protein
LCYDYNDMGYIASPMYGFLITTRSRSRWQKLAYGVFSCIKVSPRDVTKTMLIAEQPCRKDRLLAHPVKNVVIHPGWQRTRPGKLEQTNEWPQDLLDALSMQD